MVDYTGTKEGLEETCARIPACKAKLFDMPTDKKTLDIQPTAYNEGFRTSGQVQYVCRCGNFKEKGLPYHGALRVLKVMMGYDYLWLNVRVKGGAYGCMCNFQKTGESYFVSYRDPNLAETLSVYANAAEYIRNFKADERTMTKYIIGAISDKDTPLTPQAKGVRSMTAYFADYDFEMEQQERDELLTADETVIRSLAEYISAFMEQDYICVIGGEEKIKDNSALFAHTENLLGNADTV
jgi:Zn-dependent M16 (insulinase) family peptidase